MGIGDNEIAGLDVTGDIWLEISNNRSVYYEDMSAILTAA